MAFITIKEEWESYLAIIPKNAHPVQVQESRRAFYAGCISMRRLFDQCSGDDVTEDQGVKMLMALELEINAFHEDVKAGRM